MALINCPECGKEVSDSATTCPHCGYGLKKEKTKAKMNLNIGNYSSKITATNAVAMIIQIVLFVFLFFDSIKVYFSHNGDGTSSLYSIAKLSFTNVDKKIDQYEYYLREGGRYDGAYVGFVVLLLLFLTVIIMMTYEFVKNQLWVNPIFSAAIVLITNIYAIIFYNNLSNFSAKYSDTDAIDEYFYSSSGLAIGKFFIALCIIVCLIKLINYWLHYENKTELLKDIPLDKVFNKLKSLKEKN